MPSLKTLRPAVAVAVLAIGLGVGSAAAQPAPAQRPNIVFIMTDDHAAHAISAYGSKVNQTPHLDRLAKEGALFTSVFATNSICTPSRAAILTGQYSHLNGVTMFNRFDSARMTVARLGVQMEFVAKTFARRAPSFASRSRCGVSLTREP